MEHVDTKTVVVAAKPKVTDGIICLLSLMIFSVICTLWYYRTAINTVEFLLCDVVNCCPYTIKYVYSDNEVEYKGSTNHPLDIVFYAKNMLIGKQNHQI